METVARPPEQFLSRSQLRFHPAFLHKQMFCVMEAIMGMLRSAVQEERLPIHMHGTTGKPLPPLQDWQREITLQPLLTQTGVPQQ